MLEIIPDTLVHMKTYPSSFSKINHLYFRKLPPRIAAQFMTWEWDTRRHHADFVLMHVPEGVKTIPELVSRLGNPSAYEFAHHGELLLYNLESPSTSSKYRGIVALRDMVEASSEPAFFAINGQPTTVSLKLLLSSRGIPDEQPFAILLKSRK